MGKSGSGQAWVSFSIQLHRDQRAAVQRVAEASELSAADVIRMAVREFLAKNGAVTVESEATRAAA